jgi:hypothetical protein
MRPPARRHNRAAGRLLAAMLLSSVWNACGASSPPERQPPLLSACSISLPAAPRRIPPDIYGLAAAPLNVLSNYHAPLNRWGGNTACRYNWRLGNAWNTGTDWFFENVGIESQAWQGFLRRAEATGGRAIVTLPLLGFVAKDTQSFAFSIHKYGPQQKHDPHRPDAGNGVRPDGRPVTGNDRFDTSIVADPPFVAAWVTQMQHDFPKLFQERRIILALGNEPMLWNVTHRDVHPEPVSYDSYLSRFIAMARAVRQVAPNAEIAGPALWGWPAYTQSAADRERRDGADRQRHGNEPFLPWFLKQLHAHEQKTGERLLDIVTVHFYPQAEGVYSDATDLKATALRIESVRSLYDPTYRDPSWINDCVMLIPRLKRWVADSYPGLKIGITEYNWGGMEDVSGALALADILGIFGREGLDLACFWTYPPEGSYAARAYALYRNADGRGAAFGEQALDVNWDGTTPAGNPLSVYAARDTSCATVTLIAVNRSALPRTLRLTFNNIAVSQGTGYVVQSGCDEIVSAPAPFIVKDRVAQLTLDPRSVMHVRFPETP